MEEVKDKDNVKDKQDKYIAVTKYGVTWGGGGGGVNNTTKHNISYD